MNDILAPLYYTMYTDIPYKERKATHDEDTEADTFWCFLNLMINVKDWYALTSIDDEHGGVQSFVSELDSRLRTYDSVLWKHLMEHQVLPSYYSVRWFTTLLAREFPLPDVQRLWDSLLTDLSFDLLIFCGVSMLILTREVILTSDFVGMMKHLQDFPPFDTGIICDTAQRLRNNDISILKYLKHVQKKKYPKIPSRFGVITKRRSSLPNLNFKLKNASLNVISSIKEFGNTIMNDINEGDNNHTNQTEISINNSIQTHTIKKNLPSPKKSSRQLSPLYVNPKKSVNKSQLSESLSPIKIYQSRRSISPQPNLSNLPPFLVKSNDSSNKINKNEVSKKLIKINQNQQLDSEQILRCFCSWCFKTSVHQRTQANYFPWRGVYKCTFCSRRTLPCRLCEENMARGTQTWDDELCAKCNGRFALELHMHYKEKDNNIQNNVPNNSLENIKIDLDTSIQNPISQESKDYKNIDGMIDKMNNKIRPRIDQLKNSLLKREQMSDDDIDTLVQHVLNQYSIKS